jgi:hypothetical protein
MEEAAGEGSRAGRTSAELELLWCCARTSLSPAAAGSIDRLLAGSLQWHDLLRAGGRHAVLPLLGRTLGGSFADAVPFPILALLEDHARATAERNRKLARELLRLVELLATHEIPTVPLKGPSLAISAYGDLALREFGDLDLLIPAGDLLRVRDLLVSRGYRPRVDLTDEAVGAGLHHLRYHHRFRRRDGGEATVEVHWRLMESYYRLNFAEQDLWRDLARVPVCGASLPALPPERLLVYLCAHGAKHAWVQLSLVCDVAELIRRQRRLDWHAVEEGARRLGARRLLSVGLALAAALLDGEVPREARQLIAGEPVAGKLARRIRRRHLAHPRPAAGLGARRIPGCGLRMGDLLFNLRVKDHLSTRVAMGLAVAFDSLVVSWVVRPLPRPLRWRLSLLRRLRGRATRLAALWTLAAVAAGYYLLLPLAKLFRRGALRLGRT